jgi:hypothetical protein
MTDGARLLPKQSGREQIAEGTLEIASQEF